MGASVDQKDTYKEMKMGSKALAKLKKLNKKSNPVMRKSSLAMGGFHGSGDIRKALEESVIGSMMSVLSKVGDAVSEADSWREESVFVCAGLEVTVSIPRIPVVEIGFCDLLDSLYVSAVDIVKRADDVGWASKDLDHVSKVVEIVFILMKAQGWKFNHRVGGGVWRSPSWLYPAVLINKDVVSDYVADELGVPLEISGPVEDGSVSLSLDFILDPQSIAPGEK